MYQRRPWGSSVHSGIGSLPVLGDKMCQRNRVALFVSLTETVI